MYCILLLDQKDCIHIPVQGTESEAHQHQCLVLGKNTDIERSAKTWIMSNSIFLKIIAFYNILAWQLQYG